EESTDQSATTDTAAEEKEEVNRRGSRVRNIVNLAAAGRPPAPSQAASVAARGDVVHAGAAPRVPLVTGRNHRGRGVRRRAVRHHTGQWTLPDAAQRALRRVDSAARPTHLQPAPDLVPLARLRLLSINRRGADRRERRATGIAHDLATARGERVDTHH